MEWKKKGLIYKVEGKNDWAFSHTCKPTPFVIDHETVRVYFGVRSRHGKTRTTFCDIDVSDFNNFRVKYIHDTPVIDLGKIGTFDDSGANVCDIVKAGDLLYMYYIGWNPSTTVHTRNAVGLAVSSDGGVTFKRMYEGPVLDRNKMEPYHAGAVNVHRCKDSWKMWYNYGHGWKIINGRPEIQYYIRYATSDNGIDWVREGIDCIIPTNPYECTARPCVFLPNENNELYRMWYCHRSMDNFRVVASKNYRGGYAESYDGLHWIRKDDEFGLTVSNETNEWDSEAIAYPYVVEINGRLVMFYNGNGFGKSGFGYAVFE